MKLIKFKQDNCVPCKMLDDQLKDLGVQIDETYNITSGGMTDIMMAGQYNVMKTPQLILIDENGNEIDRVVGVGQTKVKEILAKSGLI